MSETNASFPRIVVMGNVFAAAASFGTPSANSIVGFTAPASGGDGSTDTIFRSGVGVYAVQCQGDVINAPLSFQVRSLTAALYATWSYVAATGILTVRTYTHNAGAATDADFAILGVRAPAA